VTSFQSLASLVFMAREREVVELIVDVSGHLNGAVPAARAPQLWPAHSWPHLCRLNEVVVVGRAGAHRDLPGVALSSGAPA
jgi:hypothetical protein